MDHHNTNNRVVCFFWGEGGRHERIVTMDKKKTNDGYIWRDMMKGPDQSSWFDDDEEVL